MVPRVSHVFWTKRIFLFSLFPDIFCVQRILLFPCFQTLSVFKEFFRFPVSGHFPYSRDLGVSLFLDILTFQKCLETGKTTKSLLSRNFVIFPVYSHFLNSKVSRNRKTTKALEKIIIFKGFSYFWTLLITENVK